MNKAFQLQRPLRKNKETEEEETLDFDVGAWEKEQEKIRREKLRRYEKSLSYLLERAQKQGEITLEELARQVREEGGQKDLIPNVQIFKEIMVELIRNKEINIPALQKEQREYIGEQSGECQLNVMLLYLIEEYPQFADIVRIETYRMEDGKTIHFPEVLDEDGEMRTVRCSNVQIQVIREGQ